MKKKSKYRVGIVGCGQIGALFEAEPLREKPASHAGAAVANHATTLVALVDTNKKSLAAAQKLFPGVVGYASLAECLKSERLDIVVIATPPRARAALLAECVRSNVRMVVCEKPLANDLREAERMKKMVEKSGTTLVLNYQRRFSPLFARTRFDIQKGKLGLIQQVTGYYSNGLSSNGGHIIDALAYLLDDEIVSVRGEKNRINTTHSAGDMNVDALLATRRGATIVLQSFDQKKFGIHDIRIYGTKGSLVITDYGITRIETPARPSRFVGIPQLDSNYAKVLHAPLSATKDALGQVIEWYEKRGSPASSAASGLATLRVLDAIARSAKRGGAKISL